jgi:hypothetical protein
MTKNIKKFYLDQELHIIYLSLGLHNGKKPSALKREHPALQNIQIFFLLLRVIFALLHTDPDSESGSGSTDPIESGSATLPTRC